MQNDVVESFEELMVVCALSPQRIQFENMENLLHQYEIKMNAKKPRWTRIGVGMRGMPYRE